MYAIVNMEYDCYYSDVENVESVMVFHNINNKKEYDELNSEFNKIVKEVDKTRKARKIRKSLANFQDLMKELGYPVSWEDFIESKGVSYEKVAFDIV